MPAHLGDLLRSLRALGASRVAYTSMGIVLWLLLWAVVIWWALGTDSMQEYFQQPSSPPRKNLGPHNRMKTHSNHRSERVKQ
jgi:hypothetical protein